ncbi:MAG TPA: LytTR family transcriptional regulator DNA-binding domain-containing protein [Chitinophagaceae bacterium]|jgi:DNA-binding LytR/AlgR family response regulator|nr:LytTR family transcriptional regulator DNA-binding domain-containing protein [Chitinophagaceae bacterium]
MNGQQEILIARSGNAAENIGCDNLHLPDSDAVEAESKIIPIDNAGTVHRKARRQQVQPLQKEITGPKIIYADTENETLPPGILRLFVKNGEYVYARANDIIMIESCDHLVKVHLGIDGKVKHTIRHSTLKDFLGQLPEDMFLRIGRFCAINMRRLSGGNCNLQAFEFDYTISIKLKHAVPHTVFTGIGD